MNAKRAVAAAQAGIFVGSGLWPVISMRSFEAVTGPKRDKWLVKTVGLLIAAIGTTLAVSAKRGVHPEAALIGAASAATLAVCDVVFVARRAISKVYLLDAALETSIVALWVLAWRRTKRARWAR
jgi:hypothetical protein